MVQPVARLVPPHGDKHWSFQIANRSEEHEFAVKASMRDPAVQAAKPFIQGLSRDWLMVEFWTADRKAVDDAAKQLASRCGVDFEVGELTRQDLGLA
jgi:hypothetical protein